MREKLIELIREGRYDAEAICNQNDDCQSCPITDPNGNCKYGCIADHLIANGVTIQKWIPVTERLPEDDLPKGTKRKMIRCLVYTDKGTVKPCVRHRWEHFDGKMQRWMWNKDLYAKPTHWMPLPEPPKGK